MPFPNVMVLPALFKSLWRRLKKAISDLTLDKLILKEALVGKY